jgi:hypothetical protein
MPHTPDAVPHLSRYRRPPSMAARTLRVARAVCCCPRCLCRGRSRLQLPSFCPRSLAPDPTLPRPRSHSCDVGPWNISRMIVIPPDVGHGGVPRAADQPRCGKPAKPQIGLIVTRCVNVTEPAANPARSPLLVMPLATTTLLPLPKSRTRLTQFNRRKLRHSKPPGIVCSSGGGNLSRTCGSVDCHIRQAKAKEEVDSKLNGGLERCLYTPSLGLLIKTPHLSGPRQDMRLGAVWDRLAPKPAGLLIARVPPSQAYQAHPVHNSQSRRARRSRYHTGTLYTPTDDA